MMDGVAGYVTHVAMYLGIMASASQRGYGWVIVVLGVLAGFCTIVHAQMYDYHRTTYSAYAIKGEVLPAIAGKPHGGVVGVYEAMQRVIAGRHPEVERLIAARLVDGRVREDDRERYRACFYRPVRGWNLMGDNIRRLAIVVAVWAGRPEWFIFSELGPVNAAFAVLWLVQRRADGHFLTTEADTENTELP
jgi:hypothetical protein